MQFPSKYSKINKFEDLKGQKQKNPSQKNTDRAAHLGNTEIAPTDDDENEGLNFDNILADEESYDGNLIGDWYFTQNRVISEDISIDFERKEIVYDV